MKKILSLFIVMLLMLGMLSGCSGESKTWDEIKEDVNLLVENGFVVLKDDTPEVVETSNSIFQTQLYGYDIDFLITNTYVLYDSESPSDSVGFTKFETKSQAKKVYNILVKESQGGQAKSWLFGDIFVSSNSERATELLNY